MRCFFSSFFAFNIFIFVTGKCPDGSITSIFNSTNCYTFIKEKMNWFAADQKCANLSGSLISLHDMFENQYVSGEAGSFFTDSANSDFWIGAIYNSLSPGKWSWIDKTPFDFTDWDIKQPQNTSDSLCASAIMNGAKWQSINCFEQKPFVCLVKSQPSICPNGWTYYNYTNSCYKVIVKSSNWFDAELSCVKEEESHLISIHSYEEFVFAIELAHPYSTNDCSWEAQTWIGLSTNDDNVHWEWTDGTPFDFTTWAPGEPDDPGKQNCGFMLTSIPCTGQLPAVLYNNPCNRIMPNYICKKAP